MNDRAGVLPVPVINPLTKVLYPAGTSVAMTALPRRS